MPFCKLIRMTCTLLLSGSILLAGTALAEEPAATGQEVQALNPALSSSSSLVERAATRTGAIVAGALELIGIRYRRGGSSPETGFDCSGLIDHVFKEGLGLILPHSARAIAKAGNKVKLNDLQPGDLVFFNTMRHAFSHVGIYLGDSQFLHAPRTGGEVRIEDIRENYWAKRFNGARRVAGE